ncbi:MAG: M15 family metallopeptidase [Nitriliruptorales bacterium]|nr:M15 family metallopeptidase [Nitriliruptorales bacterium]
MNFDLRRAGMVGTAVLVVLVGSAAVGWLSGPDEVTPAQSSSPTPSPSLEVGASGASAASPTPDPSPSPSPAERGAIAIWSREPLPAGFAASVGALPSVVAAVEVRSDTLGLIGVRDAAGVSQLDLRDGFRVPVGVAAIDPDAYATFVEGPSAEAVRALRPGEVLLTEAGAELRGIGAGGQIDLVGLPGLTVAGVVPDGTVRRSEVILHLADAPAAGIEDDPTVVVRHTANAGGATDRLVDAIRALVPTGTNARVVDVAGDRNASRGGPIVRSLTEVKRRFGEFAFRPRDGVREVDVAPAFVEEHIVTAEVPILGQVTCHRGIIDDLRATLEAIVAAGLSGEIDPSRYAGCYYPRRISVGGSSLSRHSWGIALDINVDLSHPDLGPPPHPDVVAAFEAHGFRWGGDFLHPDNHHFEWVGTVDAPPAPTDP